jgi:PAS domain S-box-containing protein
LDLPGRLHPRLPGPVVRVLVGVGLAGLAFLGRALIEMVIPGGTPFALAFPTLLAATALAGWEAGLTALVTFGVLGWHFLLAHGAWKLNLAEAVSLAILAVSGCLVLLMTAAFRSVTMALRTSEERLALAIETGRIGVWERRLDTFSVTYSEEAKRICGFPPDEPVTFEMVRDLVHPDDFAEASMRFERACDPAIRDWTPHEYRIIRPSGEVRWVLAQARVFFGPDKSGAIVPVRNVGVLQDVTARKADEERLRLLAREVDHRANNLLAVVQGTVALSQAKDTSALKGVITGRINALARAHQLLSQARWEGADLRRLVSEELLAFSLGDDARVLVKGPAVALPPAAAQALAMALHELATNAAKYGALSAADGRVEVTWRRDRSGVLKINWRETGGPLVTEPTHQGLGTALLGRALSGAIGGRTSLAWRREGLACELIVPASAMEPAGGKAEQEPAGAEPAREPSLLSAR